MNQCGNQYIDDGPPIIQPPDHRDLKVTDPEDYIIKINELDTPNERLWKLFISVVNLQQTPSHEAFWIRKFMIVGASAGFFAGALLNSPDIHQDYVRQHNASVFDNKYVGNRHFWDTLVYRCSGRGMRYGAKACAITTATAVIGISSLTYRNKLYLPDWIVGYTTLGALSRLWRGPRAMAVGGVIWCALGLFGYGVFRGLEKVSGISVSEMEYLSHKQWMISRQELLNRNHLAKDLFIADYVQREFGQYGDGKT